jgi:ABC-type branched-subunit amino acid transport system ATPase component
MTVEAIVEDSVKQGISLLAITDHNSDKNVQSALAFAQKFAGQLLVIPGVEITTANGHLLAYFPPDKPERVRDLLAVIKIQGNYGDRDSHTAMSMPDVMTEVERLKGICVAAHIDRAKTGFDAAIPGYPNIKRDIVTNSGLYGIELDDTKALSWYSLEDDSTPDGSERKKLFNARSQSTATAPRLRLAAVQNSDAHSSTDLAGKRGLTRYKMNELSFEGLRMALIDPEARVRVVATIPLSFPRIIGMHTTGGFLDGETFAFSDNLNTFIGGRGAGKSTAIQSIAYGLGISEALAEHDNCPETTVIYCEDANGIMYRYERGRGFAPDVRAKEEDQPIKDVPADSFRVEFFGQGDLAEVAKNPLKNPELLQEFLDRHISIRDLAENERELLEELAQNSAQLIPYIASNSQLAAKKATVQQLDVKLKLAETGKVKEIAQFQITLSAEKSVVNQLTIISKQYISGVSLPGYYHDYARMESSAGKLTNSSESVAQRQAAKATIEKANEYLRARQSDINIGLKVLAQELQGSIQKLKEIHSGYDSKINERMAQLRTQGLSGSIEDLNRMITQRANVAGEVAKLESDIPHLNLLQTRRNDLLSSLIQTRDAVMARRKAQLMDINKNLGNIIKDYTVVIYYDKSGVISEFKNLVSTVMQGTYCPDDVIELLCNRVTPQELAEFVKNGAADQIAAVGAISSNWAHQVVQRFQILTNLHALEVTWKAPKPIIKVMTKASQPKQIPVNQLSDGQKHTILLTIAMLSQSNLPLIIDQPEDDLDNAFIFSSVVATLRQIKEHRQVIVVTHNANIAVLGDSELLFPMKRNGDNGQIFDRGSVDRVETKQAVQEILEGGELAFRRRKEIYGY